MGHLVRQQPIRIGLRCECVPPKPRLVLRRGGDLKMEVWPGRPFPLGATAGPDGTNFAVASEIAEGITLCLFDESGAEQQLALAECDSGIWHGFVRGVGPVSYTHLRAHETRHDLVCRLLLEKKKTQRKKKTIKHTQKKTNKTKKNKKT